MKKQNEMTAFNYFFALMCIFAMGYFIFSIFYTYVYYPPIWKNIIEGFMEVCYWNFDIQGILYTSKLAPTFMQNKMKTFKDF